MKTVLIVEDNDANLELFNSILLRAGYNTLQAKSGREAIELARQQRPDLIVMDFLLPELSGLEVTKILKQDDELKEIPVIATTAFPFEDDEETFTEEGCAAYVLKPISIPDFLKTVSEHLPD